MSQRLEATSWALDPKTWCAPDPHHASSSRPRARRRGRNSRRPGAGRGRLLAARLGRRGRAGAVTGGGAPPVWPAAPGLCLRGWGASARAERAARAGPARPLRRRFPPAERSLRRGRGPGRGGARRGSLHPRDRAAGSRRGGGHRARVGGAAAAGRSCARRGPAAQRPRLSRTRPARRAPARPGSPWRRAVDGGRCGRLCRRGRRWWRRPSALGGMGAARAVRCDRRARGRPGRQRPRPRNDRRRSGRGSSGGGRALSRRRRRPRAGGQRPAPGRRRAGRVLPLRSTVGAAGRTRPAGGAAHGRRRRCRGRGDRLHDDHRRAGRDPARAPGRAGAPRRHRGQSPRPLPRRPRSGRVDL